MATLAIVKHGTSWEMRIAGTVAISLTAKHGYQLRKNHEMQLMEVRRGVSIHLLAMPFQCLSSPYSLKICPSSASDQVFRICSALTSALGPMRISKGASLVKLNPLCAWSTCRVNPKAHSLGLVGRLSMWTVGVDVMRVFNMKHMCWGCVQLSGGICTLFLHDMEPGRDNCYRGTIHIVLVLHLHRGNA